MQPTDTGAELWRLFPLGWGVQGQKNTVRMVDPARLEGPPVSTAKENIGVVRGRQLPLIGY